MIQISIVETTASQTILSARPSTSSRLWRAASTITRFVFVRRVACKAKAEVSKKRGLWQSIHRKKIAVRSRQKATVVCLTAVMVVRKSCAWPTDGLVEEVKQQMTGGGGGGK